ncbi:hypothetical protein K438DRAFT_1815632 [Mycena galopus ATCC 62051]|nr:hypothetical protein K438DRAFT_1815632 [Mycena galopus ATCC 62051]
MATASPRPSSRWGEQLLGYVAIAVNALQEVSDSYNAPFLGTISGVTNAIMSTVQSVKSNQEECMRMVEQIHSILCILARLCVNHKGVFPPSMLGNIGRFAESLQKIQSFMQTQKDQGKFKRLLKTQENAAQLENCKASLKHDVNIFSMQAGLGLLWTTECFDTDAEQRQKQLMDLIWDEEYISESSSLISREGGRSFSGSSVSLLSLLPPSPKLFHGREEQLQQVVTTLLSAPSYVALLGTGGIGKTSLAIAVLHHPAILSKFPRRFFVSCESTASQSELLAAIGRAIGLEQPNSTLRSILHALSGPDLVLLVLDNVETIWEPLDSRNDLEEFLSKLNDIPNLSLVITLRGAERPGKVRWTRPFLPQLGPLSDAAAREAFIDVADSEETTCMDEILQLAGNLPLAINLMANLAAVEGCEAVLSRWKNDRTTLLRDGHDKLSSLEKSISISLLSTRITSTEGAQELLSLLSLLPNGLSEAELFETCSQLKNIQSCRAALLRTSLAYLDGHKRLRVLTPIREYVLSAYRPSHRLVWPLRKYMRDLVNVCQTYQELSPGSLVPHLVANLSNISAVMMHGIHAQEDLEDLKQTVVAVIHLDEFRMDTMRSSTELLHLVPGLLEIIHDEGLYGRYIWHRLRYHPEAILDVDALGAQGLKHFQNANDPEGEGEVHCALANYYCRRAGDLSKARAAVDRALVQSQRIENGKLEVKCLHMLLVLMVIAGDPIEGIKTARECQRLDRLSGRFSAEAKAMTSEAQFYMVLGDLKKAQELCRKARSIVIACGLEESVRCIHITDIEADIHLLKTEYSDCRSLHVTLSQATAHSPLFHASSLAHIAYMDLLTGAAENKVLENLDAAKILFTANRLHWGLLFVETTMADIRCRQGNNTDAGRLYQELLWKSGMDYQLLGRCLEKLGDPTRGLSCPTYTFVYFAHTRKARNLASMYDALRCLGDLFHAQGDAETALSLFYVALDGSTWMDIHRTRATCMTRLGHIFAGRGDLDKGRKMLEDAQALYLRSSQTNQVAAIGERLRDLQLG